MPIRRKRKMSWKEQVMLLFAFIMAVVFAPTTIMLTIGMLPAIVASFVDKTGQKTLGLTVGAMNLAGCVPFVLELWTADHTIDQSMRILSDPFTIMVMYAAAAVGYMIDWALTGIVAVFMAEQGRGRIKAIEIAQNELVRKWGREVTGDVRLSSDGYPVDSAEDQQEDNDTQPRG
jgi:hypothetical protein